MAEAILQRPLLSGRMLVRLRLRRAAAESNDAATKTAIGKAVLDDNFIDGLTTDAMHEAGVDDSTSNTALPSGWLTTLLNWLVANLPAILALIMALFGGGA